jgi:hypothetical protein
MALAFVCTALLKSFEVANKTSDPVMDLVDHSLAAGLVAKESVPLPFAPTTMAPRARGIHVPITAKRKRSCRMSFANAAKREAISQASSLD